MYRPIDVIFRHPVKKFTVLYQNGVLWQLPKLDFDSQSLQYKKRYRGSRKEIFVAANQKPNPSDQYLTEQLLTIDLPRSIVGRDVDEFDHWWRYNWFKYNELMAKKIIQQKNAPQSQLTEKNLFSTPRTAIETSEISLGENEKYSDALIYDVLDNMLIDLMNE